MTNLKRSFKTAAVSPVFEASRMRRRRPDSVNFLFLGFKFFCCRPWGCTRKRCTVLLWRPTIFALPSCVALVVCKAKIWPFSMWVRTDPQGFVKTEIGSVEGQTAREVEDRITNYFRTGVCLVSKAESPLFRSLSVLCTYKTARFIETALCVWR